MQRRPDLGQTSTSYLGVVALAAAVIAAVLAVGVPDAIGDGVQRALCTITSGRACGGRPGGTEVAIPVPTPLELATAGRLVAIGDSFSSGEGAYDYEDGSDRDGECHRSTHAYAYELAGDLDFADGSSFVACSGAKARNVLEKGQNGEPAQIEAVDERASLVTIGIGGNDADWVDALRSCLVSKAEGTCIEDRATADRNIEEAADRAFEVYRAARERAPQARIVAVGYPRFFRDPPVDDQYVIKVGLCTPVGCPYQERRSISTEEQAYLSEQTRRFNARLAQRAADAGAEFVDLSEAFEGHEIGTADSYFNGVEVRLPSTSDRPGTLGEAIGRFNRAETLHPNAQGQQAMAAAIHRQVVAPADR